MCAFSSYFDECHSNQLGYYDISCVGITLIYWYAYNNFYTAQDRLGILNLFLLLIFLLELLIWNLNVKTRLMLCWGNLWMLNCTVYNIPLADKVYLYNFYYSYNEY